MVMKKSEIDRAIHRLKKKMTGLDLSESAPMIIDHPKKRSERSTRIRNKAFKKQSKRVSAAAESYTLGELLNEHVNFDEPAVGPSNELLNEFFNFDEPAVGPSNKDASEDPILDFDIFMSDLEAFAEDPINDFDISLSDVLEIKDFIFSEAGLD